MCPFSILAFLQPTTVDKEPQKRTPQSCDILLLLNKSSNLGSNNLQLYLIFQIPQRIDGLWMNLTHHEAFLLV